MVAAFPIAKLAALLMKQASKPLANVVKRRAKSSVFFRTYICMPPAQFYHWCEVKMKMWSMNLGAAVKIPKLNETMAIELGAELLGEGVIFTIAAGILIAEYVRSSRKEAAKEDERLTEMIRIQAELKELYFAKAKQETQIKELVRILHVNLPTVEFQMPSQFSEEGIPEQYRSGYIEEDKSGGIWSGMKSLVWKGIDILLPPVDDQTPTQQQQQPQHHQQQQTRPASSSDNSRSSTSSMQQQDLKNVKVETPPKKS